MLSTTFKRSAATLGVLAGLLASAAPAGAQFWEGQSLRAQIGPGTIGLKAGSSEVLMETVTVKFDAKSAKEGLYFDGMFFDGYVAPGSQRPAAVHGVDMTLPLLWQGNLANPAAILDAHAEI